MYGTTGDESLTMFDGARTTFKGVIFALHGRSLTAGTWGPITYGTAYEHVRALIKAGYVVVAVDAAGPFAWSSPTAMTVIETARVIALARFGGTKIGLLGFSMGGQTALNYMKRHPTLVSGAYLFSPVTDLSFMYAPSGYIPAYSTGGVLPISTAQTEVNTAYGCTTATYASVTSGYRIYDEYATWNGLAPVCVCHADDDPTVPVGQAKAFVAGVADPRVTLRELATGGHGPWTGIDPSEVSNFYNSLAWS